MALPNQKNFIISSSVTFDLTADNVSDTLDVSGLVSDWSIQSVNVTGVTGGVPDVTLQASLDGTEWKDYEPTFYKNKTVPMFISGDKRFSIPYFRLSILANGTTAGTCEFLISGF